MPDIDDVPHFLKADPGWEFAEYWGTEKDGHFEYTPIIAWAMMAGGQAVAHAVPVTLHSDQEREDIEWANAIKSPDGRYIFLNNQTVANEADALKQAKQRYQEQHHP